IGISWERTCPRMQSLLHCIFIGCTAPFLDNRNAARSAMNDDGDFSDKSCERHRRQTASHNPVLAARQRSPDEAAVSPAKNSASSTGLRTSHQRRTMGSIIFSMSLHTPGCEQSLNPKVYSHAL
ncbi:hypothetical protein, partial [Pseudomonas asturiensis]|uniref:hypothetical protein n=1 Tax=Pseudomonas asturiensis TaxID=1190415 RepID=UPI001C314E14